MVTTLTAWFVVAPSPQAAEPGAVRGSDVMDGKDKPGS
jgi:hypothetical protein